MASCLVCAAPASVYCQQDNAFLCTGCDVSIHTANALSKMHIRLPCCALCHRQVASVWCKEDAAHLCSVCDGEVHSSNPIPHARESVKPISSPHVTASACPTPCAMSGAQGAAPAVPQMEDSNSACGFHAAHSPPPACELGVQGKEGSCEVRSVAVVPEMPAPLEEADTGATAGAGEVFLPKAPSLPKGFDFLDLDNSWLDRLDTGFDFSDIFNAAPDAPPTDGLVPTLSDNRNGNSPQEDLLNSNGNAAAVHSAHEEHDLLVPSFSLSLPDELPLPQLGGGAPKRPAEDATDALLPASKQQRPSSYSMSAQQSAPFQLKQESQVPAPMMAAPQWQAAPAPALAPPPPPHRQPVHTTTTHHAPGYGAGAELTREQRVARYREKRKSRKFEKTIRYASRKAYAEVRPRIKGRFATREEVIALRAQKEQQEQQQQLQLQAMLDEDCVVPNFA
ncbi:hypothetical protein DUNSADRAFT_15768 [Dunaliella salina]|uniref:Uncharacterized protein n=1 Tax=Dunaliella salina TaxID=3046 RepID=A0ABQ7H9E8_DUNSA|nr:hypothetical protein DUNSADRAFT_15768 [Dunaliella salina]|eukprot:KAF5843473.1 hypothetical protein DUNSADRAFT_15768 [Dunaliella salina]